MPRNVWRYRLGLAGAVGSVVLGWAYCTWFAGELPKPGGDYRVRHNVTTVGEQGLQVELHYPDADHGESTQRFPLVLFAPGWRGHVADQSLFLGELASYGYVGCGFDDVAYGPEPLAETAEAQALRTSKLDWSTEQRFAASMHAGDVRVALSVQRALAVLEAVEQQAKAGVAPFTQVDLSRVGFVGYSFGGAVALETRRASSKVMAVVNIDGSPFGETMAEGIVPPALVVSSDGAFPSPETRASTHEPTRILARWCVKECSKYRERLGDEGFFWYRAHGTRHQELSDQLFFPAWQEAFRHSWQSRLALRAELVAVIADFLGTYVAGKRSGAGSARAYERLELLDKRSKEANP